MKKSFHSQACFTIYYLQKFYLNEKLNLLYLVRNFHTNARNKEQTNSKVPSKILPLHKASSWILQLSLCKYQFSISKGIYPGLFW